MNALVISKRSPACYFKKFYSFFLVLSVQHQHVEYNYNSEFELFLVFLNAEKFSSNLINHLVDQIILLLDQDISADDQKFVDEVTFPVVNTPNYF